MLISTLELKEALIYIYKLTSNKEYKRVFLTSDQWHYIEDLIKVFQVFLKPSIKLQGQAYITLPKGLLYIYQIYKKLKDLKDDFYILGTIGL